MKAQKIQLGSRVVNFYEFLGVEEKASSEELKKAYRALCLKYHPDKNAGSRSAENNFKVVQSVWGVLSNAAKRADYDFRLSAEKRVVHAEDVGMFMNYSMTFGANGHMSGFTWGFTDQASTA